MAAGTSGNGSTLVQPEAILGRSASLSVRRAVFVMMELGNALCWTSLAWTVSALVSLLVLDVSALASSTSPTAAGAEAFPWFKGSRGGLRGGLVTASVRCHWLSLLNEKVRALVAATSKVISRN